MKKWLFLSIALLFAMNSKAQQTAENKLGSWYMCYVNSKLLDKLSTTVGVEMKEYEVITNFNQLLILTGLNYHVQPNFTATTGYMYLYTDKTFDELPNEVNSKEHRLYEQISLKNKLWNIKLSHRYRLEQRFKSTKIEHRIRYRFQFILPITKIIFCRFYDEIFFNLQGSPFNQNRLFVAIGTSYFQFGKIQLGYLRNNFNSTDFNRLQVGLFLNLGFLFHS